MKKVAKNDRLVYFCKNHFKNNMPSTIKIYNKTEIINGLSKAFQEVEDSISTIENELFINCFDGKWSVAENFQHLILSAKPVVSMLKKPKVVFNIFGQAKKPSRSYELLEEDYKKVLKNGAVATSNYIPDSSQNYSKREMLANWKMIAEKFHLRVELWSENDMDKYRVPHPVLGKLTIREILFFTIFHTYHHLNRINEIRANNEKK